MYPKNRGYEWNVLDSYSIILQLGCPAFKLENDLVITLLEGWSVITNPFNHSVAKLHIINDMIT